MDKSSAGTILSKRRRVDQFVLLKMVDIDFIDQVCLIENFK